jgi:hypothetical protein
MLLSATLRAVVPEHVELMTKSKVFGFQPSPRAKQLDQGVPDQPAKIAHRWNYRQIRDGQLFWVCGRDKRSGRCACLPAQGQGVADDPNGEVQRIEAHFEFVPNDIL